MNPTLKRPDRPAPPNEHAKADARLIAAAPDLLAFLLRLRDAGTWFGSALELDHGQDGEQIEKELIALIGKATGT